MKPYFKLMRVHHYIKNLLVFTALFCSGQMFSIDKLASGTIGFLAFCMISSAIYIINDIFDLKNDQKHPIKCHRPIASGSVSLSHARIMAVVLFLLSVLCNLLVFRPESTLLLILYFLINLLYSRGLKNVPIIDIAILVTGFFIRILYGAILTEITISNWLYLTVMALSFYLALGKRRNELQQLGTDETRKVLSSYTVTFLDRSMTSCLTLAIAFYALWSMDNNRFIFTVPIVLLITLKYNLDLETQSNGDPVEVLFHDKILLAMCALYLLIMFLCLYL